MGDIAARLAVALDHGDEAEAVAVEQRRQSFAGSSATLSWKRTMPGSAVRITLAVTAFGRQVGRQLAASRADLHRAVGGLRDSGSGCESACIEHRRDLAVLDHQFAAIPGVLRLEVVVEQHEVGAAAAAEAADLAVHAEARGADAASPCSRPAPASCRRGTASRTTQSRPKSSRSSASRSSVQTQMRLCDGAELGDGLDRLRQRVPRRGRRAAAQEDPDAGLEEVVGDVAVDRLVRVGDAAGRIGGDEFAAVDVAADRPAALRALRRGWRGCARRPWRPGTKSIFSPRATASGQRSNSAPILSGVRSPPAVSSSGEVAGTVLGTVRKMESGAWRASSSIASTPATSITLPISWLSQKIVVVPLSSAASA